MNDLFKRGFVDKIRLSGNIYRHIPERTLLKHDYCYLGKTGENTVYYQKSNHIAYSVYPYRHIISIESCPGKVVYGHNCRKLSDAELQQCLHILYCDYLDHFPWHKSAESIDTFGITRLDYTKNLFLSGHATQKHYQAFIDYMKRLELPRCQRKEYDTTITYSNKSRAITMYLKQQEVFAHALKPIIVPQFIRMEISWYRSHLCGKRKINRTLHHLNQLSCEANDELNAIIKQWHLDQPFQSKAEVIEKITHAFSSSKSANQYIVFAEELNTSADLPQYANKAKEHYSNQGEISKFYSQLRNLFKRGVFPYWSDLLAHKQITVFLNPYSAEKDTPQKGTSQLFYRINQNTNTITTYNSLHQINITQAILSCPSISFRRIPP